jgi:hypothetical protein
VTRKNFPNPQQNFAFDFNNIEQVKEARKGFFLGGMGDKTQNIDFSIIFCCSPAFFFFSFSVNVHIKKSKAVLPFLLLGREERRIQDFFYIVNKEF